MTERRFAGLYFDYWQYYREWAEERSKERIAPGTLLITPTKEESGVAALNFVLDTAFDYAKRKGTMSQLVISDHGSPMHMDNIGYIRQFLRAIERREKETGIKLTDRIVFAGCNIFDIEGAKEENSRHGTVETAVVISELIPWLRDYAMSRDMELVGTTTLLSNQHLGFASLSRGRWVVFSPTGEIKRDRLDKAGPLNAIERVKNPDPNDSWVKKADAKPQPGVDAGLEDTWVARYVAQHPEAGVKLERGRSVLH